MTGSGDESDVSSVSEVSSVHTSDLSDAHVDPDQPAKKKARTAKKRHVDPSRLRPAKALDGSVAAVKASQAHMYVAKEPIRDDDGCLVFEDASAFRPNLTPAEVIKRGSFGGGYFRSIRSSVTGLTYKEAWKEFPAEWFDGISISQLVSNPVYKKGTNKYNVKCGQNLDQWEEQGWMQEVDPYGWFQWYCRFYLGRRSHDDERQIGRGLRCMGPTGRWRTRLANLVNSKKAKYSAASVSPVIRQTLQHWGYRLTRADYEDHCDNKGLSY